MAPDQHRCTSGTAVRRAAAGASCGCSQVPGPVSSGQRVPVPVAAALAEAKGAEDPVQRFPFLVPDPEAVPVRRPDAPEPTGLELDVAGLRPGPELARLLTTIDPGRVTDWMLVELADAAVRLTSWAQAVAAQLAGALAQRGSMAVDDLRVVGGPSPDQVAGTELAMRMSWTRASATSLVRRGRAFDGPLAATGAALARGEIDAVRAQAVVRRLADVPVPVALDVQEAVLPGAGGRTAPQLRRDLERALVATDPDEAGARRSRAHATRRVERPTVLPDGMSCLRAVLPAAEAVRVHAVLDAAARTARAAGDPRTVDQLRADGLVDLVLHDACVASPVEATAGEPGTAVGPGEVGPVQEPPDRAGRRLGPAGSAVEAGGRTRCRARRRPDVLVRVTVALPTLLGVDDRPADLEGYGLVHPDTARALAAGGVWQRLVTDPLSGTLLDLGRTRYRPTVALAEHVQARDGTCVRPGCSVPARSCDLDHVRDYGRRPRDGGPPGGTSDDNLACLCPTDHRMKTRTGFRLRQRAPGVFAWVTPTGHVHDVGPAVLDPPPPPVGEPWPLPPAGPPTPSAACRPTPSDPGPPNPSVVDQSTPSAAGRSSSPGGEPPPSTSGGRPPSTVDDRVPSGDDEPPPF